jgi:uncharacterized protein RhaS with RHS repeats
MGSILTETLPPVQNTLLYSGQYMDTESGLYYLQTRY